ncbi:MAG: (Fe-S)-binding protein [Methylophilaceae bacterium]
MAAALDLLTETGRCVACGLCLPHCPTYRKTQSEADSPRGRIMLTQALLQGAIPLNERYMAHMDLCLTCRACESACPNHVEYGVIADGARAMISAQRPAKLARKLAMILVASPTLLKIAGFGLRLASLLRLQKIISRLPTTPKQRRWQSVYPATNARGEVSLFLGCASNVLDGDTLAASVYVLNRLGYTVHIPPTQTCCGGLHQQAGDSADDLNARNKQAFTGDLPVLAIASGCGARLLDLMPDRFQDVSAFLAQAEGWDDIIFTPLKAKIAVHEPCSLRNMLKTEASVYSLLKRLPAANVVPLPSNTQCCGGAGAYMLTQPGMAKKLRDDKIMQIEKTAPEYLVTSNIGCALHLADGDELQQIKIVHPVLLLAQQMGFQA